MGSVYRSTTHSVSESSGWYPNPKQSSASEWEYALVSVDLKSYSCAWSSNSTFNTCRRSTPRPCTRNSSSGQISNSEHRLSVEVTWSSVSCSHPLSSIYLYGLSKPLTVEYSSYRSHMRTRIWSTPLSRLVQGLTAFRKHFPSAAGFLHMVCKPAPKPFKAVKVDGLQNLYWVC